MYVIGPLAIVQKAVNVDTGSGFACYLAEYVRDTEILYVDKSWDTRVKAAGYGLIAIDLGLV